MFTPKIYKTLAEAEIHAKLITEQHWRLQDTDGQKFKRVEARLMGVGFAVLVEIWFYPDAPEYGEFEHGLLCVGHYMLKRIGVPA